MRLLITKSALGLLLLLLTAQLWPADRTNPPRNAELKAPPEVAEILRRSCYDCHSNETRWPWYSRIAPVSWRVERDVRAGRAQLNFSDWDGLTEERRAYKSDEIVEEIRSGSMPPASYRWLHPEAAVSPEALAVLVGWVDARAGKLTSR